MRAALESIGETAIVGELAASAALPVWRVSDMSGGLEQIISMQ